MLVTLAMDVSSDCARAIISQLEKSFPGDPPKDSLIPDLFEGLAVRSAGAGEILLKTDIRWWMNFANRAESKFRNLARSTGPLRLLLRNAPARDAADRRSNREMTHDAVWLDIAKHPQNYFSMRLPQISGIQSLSDATMRKWRSILIKEDAEQTRWIESHSGPCHPSTSSYWRENPARSIDFTTWRPRNELYYCLAQGMAGWSPLFSESFSMADWQGWLEKAETGIPPYWCPKMVTIQVG